MDADERGFPRANVSAMDRRRRIRLADGVSCRSGCVIEDRAVPEIRRIIDVRSLTRAVLCGRRAWHSSSVQEPSARQNDGL